MTTWKIICLSHPTLTVVAMMTQPSALHEIVK